MGSTELRASSEEETPLERRSTRREPWSRRVDPLIYILGAIALVVYLLHGFDGFLSRDLAVYSYGGQQAADGVPPYVGILNRAGPLAHLIPAVAVVVARVVNADEVMAIRVLFMLFSVACVCASYVLVRDMFNSRRAGLVAAGAWLSSYGFIKYATYGPREKTPMLFFLLLTLIALVHRRWLWAGVGLALSTLVLQPALLFGLASFAVALLLAPRRERLEALARFAIGGAIPTAIVLLYFTVNGALGDFFDGFLLINAEYTTADSLFMRFTYKWKRVQGNFGVSLWIILLGLAALVLLTLYVVVRRDWRSPERSSLVVVGAGCVMAIAWSIRDFNGWPDLLLLMPFAVVGVGAIVKEIEDRLTAHAALAFALAFTLATVAVALNYSVNQQNDALPRQQGSVDALLTKLPSDVTIMSISAPAALVLSERTNPTRHQMFARGLDDYVDDTWPGGLEGYVDRIRSDEVDVIALGYPKIPRWLKGLLKEDYERIAGGGPGWTWYVHGSVPLAG